MTLSHHFSKIQRRKNL